jgi:hypothetical protein
LTELFLVFIKILKVVYKWFGFHCKGKASFNVFVDFKFTVETKRVWNGRNKRRVWLTCPVTMGAPGFMAVCFFVADPSVVNLTNLGSIDILLPEEQL